MTKNSRSLRSRLTRLVILFVSVISLGFVGLAFLVLYGLEDAILNRQIDSVERSHRMGESLPTGASVISANRLPKELRPLPELGQHGEGHSDGRYFHYKRISDNESGAYLLLDATDQLVVRRSVGDLLLIFGPVSAVFLGLSLMAAWWLSSIALRPFEQLVQLVSDERLSEGEEAINRIRETDVRMLADKFRRVLIDKQAMVNEQIVFNQGISHELRTPLQIIKNSLELLQIDIQDIDQEPPFERLRRATRRMEGISSAFLWLTTSDSYNAESSVAKCLGTVLDELEPVLNEQQIRTELTVKCDMLVRVPTPVIELMLYNLISNVARHTSRSKLSITIVSNAVTLENPADRSDATQDGFRLGFDIVQRLADRFGLLFEHSQHTQSFRTSISEAVRPKTLGYDRKV